MRQNKHKNSKNSLLSGKYYFYFLKFSYSFLSCYFSSLSEQKTKRQIKKQTETISKVKSSIVYGKIPIELWKKGK